MALSRLAGKLVPDVVAARLRKAEVKAAGQVAQKVLKRGSSLEREAVNEIARHNAPFAHRAPALVAEKYRRMADTPHGFFRGSPELFYKDLATSHPQLLTSGPKALLLGDLHLGNLGVIAEANGKLSWGLVDVDEAAVGSVQAELRRMAASIRLAAREAGLGKDDASALVKDFAKSYHKALEGQANGTSGRAIALPKVVDEFLADAAGKSRKNWLDAAAPKGPAGRRFVRSEKALDVPKATADEVIQAFATYRQGLPASEAAALAHHAVADVITPVAGVNSLGRRRFRLLALPTDGKGEALVFELKEQMAPAIAGVLPQPKVASQAGRAQRAATALNGHRLPFLGETRLPGATSGDGSFLVRRLEPWHGAIDTAKLGKKELTSLVEAAGEVVAKGHAGGVTVGLADAGAILEDLGPRKDLTQALLSFSETYVNQVERDHAAFVRAVAKDALLAGRAVTR